MKLLGRAGTYIRLQRSGAPLQVPILGDWLSGRSTNRRNVIFWKYEDNYWGSASGRASPQSRAWLRVIKYLTYADAISDHLVQDAIASSRVASQAADPRLKLEAAPDRISNCTWQ